MSTEEAKNDANNENDAERAVLIDIVQDNKKEVEPVTNLLYIILWFIFGGGLIMMILWIVVALIATLLIIPSSSSINLLELLPVVIAAPRYYPAIQTVTPSCLQRTSRGFWVLPFGLILSIVHFVLMILYAPLSCCGVSWSTYHFRAMSVAFNPYGKKVIDRNNNKFTWFSVSTDIVKDVTGLKDKVVIITGCNTGIGKETAKILYSKGCIVVMACRNPEKANNARKDILEEIKDQNEANLIFIRLDLGDLKTIDEFVASYQENEIVNGKLAFLINNAGVMAFPEFGTTKDGFERQFGVNHMGHFYLVNKLLPIIKANKTRIISLSSIGHYLFIGAKVMNDFLTKDGVKGPTEDVIPYDQGGFAYYGISKLCNLLFARQINKMYNKDGVYALALHPGNIMETDLGRNMKFDWDSTKPFLTFRGVHEGGKGKSIPQGAATSLRCVTISNEEIINKGGQQLLYFDDCLPRNDKIHEDFINGKNTEIDQLLWDYSVKAIQAIDGLELNED